MVFKHNSSWMAVVEQYRGLMIEGNARLSGQSSRLIKPYSIGVDCLNQFVTKENIDQLVSASFFSDPDVLSLDIDGVDYYIAESILASGMRPKIFVVEFNSVFGATKSLTVPYKRDFSFVESHPSQLYYGVSIAAWKSFFSSHGYHFVTIDSKGVNAFFVDPLLYESDFLGNVVPVDFAENLFQQRKHGMDSAEQFKMIEDEVFVEI